MKKYMVSWLYCGEDNSNREIIEGKDDNDVIKKIYINKMGYESVREYNEDNDVKYKDLDVDDCLEEMGCDEDILEFIIDNKFNYLYERE